MDGKLVDMNMFKPERAILITEQDRIQSRQAMAPPWYAAHYQELTKDLQSIDCSGFSSSVTVIWGQKAFPIIVNDLGDPMVGGAEFGLVMRCLGLLL